jgi:CopG family transcriptional regulator, nickel-responsive regulator
VRSVPDSSFLPCLLTKVTNGQTDTTFTRGERGLFDVTCGAMSLIRFGVAMESALLARFDELVQNRKSTRSELLRDLARAEINRSLAARRVEAFASVTIVYNHHVRELSERITQMQHELGDQVRSTMHVHLDHERCLEVIVMRGRADKLQRVAERLFATRGILQGRFEIVAEAGVSTQRFRRPHGHGRAKHP